MHKELATLSLHQAWIWYDLKIKNALTAKRVGLIDHETCESLLSDANHNIAEYMVAYADGLLEGSQYDH